MTDLRAPHDPTQTPAWRSYLMPGTDVLRTVAELSSPVAVALFERMVTADAETTLRRTQDRPRTFDLPHLNDVHERLFADVYPFAGQLRYVDIGKPGQTGEPFLHHRWIETYTAAVTDQLRAQDNLVNHRDPGQWADRAAYYWASILHAHPYREGNGRSARIWIDDLAEPAGHHLDWTRSSPEHNVHVAMATAHGDYEPMRALLTVVAGGTVGIDRPIDALNDHDKLQHGQAWARTGMVFGSDGERATLSAQLAEMGERLDVVRFHLDSVPERATTIDKPAAERWRGLAASILPGLPLTEDWPRFAAELDEGVAAGIDVATELPRLAVRDSPGAAEPVSPAVHVGRTAPRAGEDDVPPPDADLVAAAYRPPRPPAPGPRR
jgi:cell filamentation protein